MVTKRLINANALLEMGRARKIIEVVGNWKELPGCAKSACVRLGIAHKQMILNAPTVDAVEVVHGRWLTLEEYAEKIGADPTVYVGGWCFCSECEQQMRAIYGWNYCPNCGAKMDGDGNGT